ncbi:amidase [Aureimonas populi]|uniref:Amidase n=1 Tax=Aureimonas populi TaxID=1701758 RepID=A0ABW5CLU1_9HYPH|nr:amidase family protein [Aureimonas populi]
MEPCDLGAHQARRLIARKALSPVELAESCIERTQGVNPAVNALVALDLEGLREGARRAEAAVMAGEALGPLHGLPLAVKDMADVAGLPTTYGSPIFAQNVARGDDPMVAQLRGAGALVMGKANNPEWSAGGNTRNSVYGATGNPFDPSRSAAGSSGGSAAALACGMAPLATGSDTGGSLRNPAAFCGIVGFRPSPGVVPGHARAMSLLPLSTSGPMARSVEDAGLMLSAMIRPDRRDPWVSVVEGRTHHEAAAFGRLPAFDLSSARVALTVDFGFTLTEGIVSRAFEEKVSRFSHVFARASRDHPDCEGADEIFAILRALLFNGQHRRLLEAHPDKVGPNVRANVEEGERYSALDVVRALEGQGALHRRWQAFFEAHDFILSPAVTISPRDWHELYPAQIDGRATASYYHWLSMAYASTLAGHPSVTIPVGLDEKGMPFGLQIVGRRGEDLSTLAFAQELEAHLAGDPALARPRPDIESLRHAPPLSQSDDFYGFG